MLPPAAMLKNKKPAWPGIAMLFAVLLVGCGPAGPKALREGRRLLGEGKYAESVEKLRQAVRLMRTNALAWNELGLAYHYSGKITNAAEAYRNALLLDRDLAEARYNLGCLLLQQGKLDAARSELTSYTLHRPKELDGWLRLGSVQLRMRDAAGAEKSFNEALKISSNNPIALNGLGLALVQRNRHKEAAQSFTAAIQAQPNYGPALLNLAVVSHMYLNDRLFALEKYREYTALKPRPVDAEAVLAVAEQLERELASAARPTPAEVAAQPATQPPQPWPQQVATGTVAAVPVPKPVLAVEPPKPTQPTGVVMATAPVRVAIEPAATPPQQETRPAPAAGTLQPRAAAAPGSRLDIEVSREPPARQPQPERVGVFDRLNPLNWFRSGQKPRPTPLPSRSGGDQSAQGPTLARMEPGKVVEARTSTSVPESAARQTTTAPTAEAAASSAQQRAAQIPRYVYSTTSKPPQGNAREAQLALAKGLEAHRARRFAEAILAYRQATVADPSCFEAYYNLGVAAYETKAYQTALEAYEKALAIEPESAAARYNFALVLRESGYLLDAVAELQKVVSANPSDARAHLALANLYAQRLGNKSQARVHYLRVLELEPAHPQATAIRYWLAANPG